MSQTVAPIGDLVRTWREQRHLSQLDLAVEADISQKHLSFIESGRSAPSRDMVLLLAEVLTFSVKFGLEAVIFPPNWVEPPTFQTVCWWSWTSSYA